jgi:hypothetical protein
VPRMFVGYEPVAQSLGPYRATWIGNQGADSSRKRGPSGPLFRVSRPNLVDMAREACLGYDAGEDQLGAGEPLKTLLASETDEDEEDDT